MIRELLDGLTTREQRVLGWSAVALAAALWLSVAWADPWVLLMVPLVGVAFMYFVRRARREEAFRQDDDGDWAF
jgi:hypothetical protein